MAGSATDNMVSLLTESFEKFSAPPPPVPGPFTKRRPRDGAELARRGEKRSRASSSVVDGVDDNDVATVIREHIKTIWRERLGAGYTEADFKTMMRRYVGRELQFHLKICHEDRRLPADNMRLVRYARVHAETGALPKSVGGSILAAASPPP
eukprot:5480158-Pyramimonas_sp.AAC.2